MSISKKHSLTTGYGLVLTESHGLIGPRKDSAWVNDMIDG